MTTSVSSINTTTVPYIDNTNSIWDGRTMNSSTKTTTVMKDTHIGVRGVATPNIVTHRGTNNCVGYPMNNMGNVLVVVMALSVLLLCIILL